MNALLDEIVKQNMVELEHRQKTYRQFSFELLPTAIAVGFVCFLPALVVEYFHPIPAVWAACTVVFSILLPVMIRNNWKEVGTRYVRLDMQRKLLIIDQIFPHQPCLKNQEILFERLLLYRYWQMDCEGGPPSAFIIRLHISKIISKPDTDGYLIHTVYVEDDVKRSDEESMAAVNRLVDAAGIQFFDIQTSGSEQFAIWINKSLMINE
jgi:hypothetical protein